MKYLIVAGLLLATSACTSTTPPAPTAAVDSCLSWPALRARLPDGAVAGMVSDPAAFLRIFNAQPPVSDQTADEIAVARHGDAAELFFLTGGCVTDHWRMPWAALEAMLGKAA